MHIHVHHHRDDASAESHRLVLTVLGKILQTMETMMSKLDDVLNDVTDESNQLDCIATLIGGLRQQVADAVATTGMSADDAAKIDAIFEAAESNKSKIAAALNANVAPAQTAPVADNVGGGDTAVPATPSATPPGPQADDSASSGSGTDAAPSTDASDSSAV